jgi:hypothetical protein
VAGRRTDGGAQAAETELLGGCPSTTFGGPPPRYGEVLGFCLRKFRNDIHRLRGFFLMRQMA